MRPDCPNPGENDPILLRLCVLQFLCCNGFESQVVVLVMDISTLTGASVEFKQTAEDGIILLCPTVNNVFVKVLCG